MEKIKKIFSYELNGVTFKFYIKGQSAWYVSAYQHDVFNVDDIKLRLFEKDRGAFKNKYFAWNETADKLHSISSLEDDNCVLYHLKRGVNPTVWYRQYKDGNKEDRIGIWRTHRLEEDLTL